MTARQQRGAALLLGGLFALFFTLITAVQVAGWTVGSLERTSHQLIPGPIQELNVEAGSGDITILPSSDGNVRVDASAKGALHSPELRAVKDGLTVRLDGDCPQITFGPCRSEIIVHVPPDTAVDVHAGSGDLVATGLTGRVDLETGSGDLVATDLAGPADLHTGSGDVDARGLRGSALLRSGSGDLTGADLATRGIKAHTSSGDVTLDFSAAPSTVDADTASGDVTIAVPQGQTYAVEADPGSGSLQTQIDTSARADRLIRANTSSGDVTLAYSD